MKNLERISGSSVDQSFSRRTFLRLLALSAVSGPAIACRMSDDLDSNLNQEQSSGNQQGFFSESASQSTESFSKKSDQVLGLIPRGKRKSNTMEVSILDPATKGKADELEARLNMTEADYASLSEVEVQDLDLKKTYSAITWGSLLTQRLIEGANMNELLKHIADGAEEDSVACENDPKKGQGHDIRVLALILASMAGLAGTYAVTHKTEYVQYITKEALGQNFDSAWYLIRANGKETLTKLRELGVNVDKIKLENMIHEGEIYMRVMMKWSGNAKPTMHLLDPENVAKVKQTLEAVRQVMSKMPCDVSQDGTCLDETGILLEILRRLGQNLINKYQGLKRLCQKVNDEVGDDQEFLAFMQQLASSGQQAQNEMYMALQTVKQLVDENSPAVMNANGSFKPFTVQLGR